MAKPPKLKTLRPEDYDFNGDASEWGPKLLQVLSMFCGDVTNALSGALNLENFAAEEREVSFTTVSSVAIDAPPFPLLLAPQKMKQPQNLVITNAAVDGVAPLGAAQAVWDRTASGQVRIRLIQGLDTNTAYKMRLRWN